MAATGSRDEAIALCVIIEALSPKFHYHVALTGGLLYKTGRRKDCDLLFYSVRQQEDVSPESLIEHLCDAVDGLEFVAWFGWLAKVEYFGKSIDVFFPESPKQQSDGSSGEVREAAKTELAAILFDHQAALS